MAVSLDLSDPKTLEQNLNDLDKRLRKEAAKTFNSLVDLRKIIEEHNETINANTRS